MASHRLRLNDLVLSSGTEEATDDAGTWWWDVYGSDFQTGAPEPLEVTMRTLLQDGARVITQGYGNREVTFYAVVGGVNSAALATAERMLALHLGRRGELGWTPPDGWAPETVFDIETSSMTWGSPGDDDDLIEVQQNERVYQLRFVCQPFVRTADPVVVPAVPVPVEALDEDVLDAGTATTRWAARIGTLTDGGAYLQVGGTRNPRPAFTPVAPVDISAQPYIALTTQFGGAPYCDVNGFRATLVGSEYATIGASNATRYYWRTTQTVVNSIEFGVDFASPSSFRFTNLRVRNLPPYSGTLRQSRRTIEVQGSTRTQGSLQVTAPDGDSPDLTDGLGTVIFYSSTLPTAIPSLRPFRVSGPNTPAAEATAVSGFVESLGSTGPVFDVPISALAPGKCQILARMYDASGASGGTYAVTWNAQTRIDGVNVGPVTTGATTVALVDNEVKVVSLGTADLPPTDLPNESDAVIRINISGSSVQYDEVWLLNLDHGALTIVEAGTHKRVWIETANNVRPRPAIYIGDDEDRSDAFHDPTLVAAWGTHEFASPITNALVVTPGCENADVGFEYFPRYMNFVSHPVEMS